MAPKHQKPRRDKLEIIKVILEHCQYIPKTTNSIINHCNLNFAPLKILLKELETKQLITSRPLSSSRGIEWLTTKSGEEYVKTFYILLGMLSVGVEVR